MLDLTDEPLAVVPLFETIADLERAPATVEALLADAALRPAGSPSAAAGSR